MRLQPFRDAGLNDAAVELAWREHATRRVPRFDKLWQYYRNELSSGTSGGIGMGRARRAWYGQGQEIGQAGSSGGVSEPQLHFEIRYAATPQERARPIDPGLVLPR